jgi:hypothetical protein
MNLLALKGGVLDSTANKEVNYGQKFMDRRFRYDRAAG